VCKVYYLTFSIKYNEQCLRRLPELRSQKGEEKKKEEEEKEIRAGACSGEKNQNGIQSYIEI